jgi:hypothetical protein
VSWGNEKERNIYIEGLKEQKILIIESPPG